MLNIIGPMVALSAVYDQKKENMPIVSNYCSLFATVIHCLDKESRWLLKTRQTEAVYSCTPFERLKAYTHNHQLHINASMRNLPQQSIPPSETNYIAFNEQAHCQKLLLFNYRPRKSESLGLFLSLSARTIDFMYAS